MKIVSLGSLLACEDVGGSGATGGVAAVAEESTE